MGCRGTSRVMYGDELTRVMWKKMGLRTAYSVRKGRRGRGAGVAILETLQQGLGPSGKGIGCGNFWCLRRTRGCHC